MSYNEKLAFTLDPTRHLSRDSYMGEELKRDPSIDQSRFKAYKLPSRTGDTLIYPNQKNYE